MPPTTSLQYRNSKEFLDGCVAIGERKIQSLEAFNSFFDGTTWTILVEGKVFLRAKVVGISVSKPGGPNFVREEADGG